MKYFVSKIKMPFYQFHTDQQIIINATINHFICNSGLLEYIVLKACVAWLSTKFYLCSHLPAWKQWKWMKFNQIVFNRKLIISNLKKLLSHCHAWSVIFIQFKRFISIMVYDFWSSKVQKRYFLWMDVIHKNCLSITIKYLESHVKFIISNLFFVLRTTLNERSHFKTWYKERCWLR